jgi:hypothetical protein
MLTLSAAEVRRLGLKPISSVPRPRSKVAKASPQLFIQACLARGLPAPVPEYVFAPPRKWALDWFFPAQRLALEIQGALFTHGRHTRGAALLKEHEKLNACAIAAIRVMFCTPDDVESGAIFPLLQKALVG